MIKKHIVNPRETKVSQWRQNGIIKIIQKKKQGKQETMQEGGYITKHKYSHWTIYILTPQLKGRSSQMRF